MAKVPSQISPPGFVIRSKNVQGTMAANSGTACLESEAVRLAQRAKHAG
jgi:hypothetical protein